MKEHTERAGCHLLVPFPPPSAPAVLCGALNLRHLGHPSSCARLGQRLGSRGKQLPLLPLETGWKNKEVARSGKSQTRGRTMPCFSVENSCLLYSLAFFLVQCGGRKSQRAVQTPTLTNMY